MPQPKTSFFSALPERDEKEIELPSGRTITVMETTGREEKIAGKFNDNSKQADVIAQFLAGVSKNLDGKEGPVTREALDNMLIGDQVRILIESRILTHGPLLTYKTDCAGCGSYGEYELNIQDILDKATPYPCGDQRKFSVELDGGVLYFELADGKVQTKNLRTQVPDANTKLRNMHLWEEGPDGPLPVSVDTLKSRQISKLRQAVREKEYEMDTILSFKCTSCGRTDSVNIIGVPSFLFPNLT